MVVSLVLAIFIIVVFVMVIFFIAQCRNRHDIARQNYSDFKCMAYQLKLLIWGILPNYNYFESIAYLLKVRMREMTNNKSGGSWVKLQKCTDFVSVTYAFVLLAMQGFSFAPRI